MTHHYFISEHVDISAVRNEAQRRAFDRRTPEDSVIHHHSHNPLGCPNDCSFEEYKANVGFSSVTTP